MSRSTPQGALWIKSDGTVTSVTPQDGNAFSLEELQTMVGGYIQLVRTKEPVCSMYINEEGLIHGLPVNPKASALISPIYSTAGGVRGDAVVLNNRAGFAHAIGGTAA